MPTKVRTPFTKQELQEWRKLLKQRREEIREDIGSLIKDAIDLEDGHTSPTHQADRGFDSDLQDLSLGMLGDEETLLWQIERAIEKIDSGKPMPFGVCEHTRKNIPKSRLNLLPWTPLSIDGANYMEENGLTLQDMLTEE